MKKALIVYGGWEGHEPVQVADAYKKILLEEDFEVEMSDVLEVFEDAEKLMDLNLIIPHWTMGTITTQQLEPVLKAVASGGVGMAGCHAGMCDAFHDSVDWQFMTGGQWVAHPGGQQVKYKVNIVDRANPITDGFEDFYTVSEQYYMHVDPAVKVLATTRFPVGREPYVAKDEVEMDECGFGAWNFKPETGYNGPHVGNGIVEMPVMWTKTFGKGRIFYSSLGHSAANFMEEPANSIMRRGILWAAK